MNPKVLKNDSKVAELVLELLLETREPQSAALEGRELRGLDGCLGIGHGGSFAGERSAFQIFLKGLGEEL